MTKIIWPVIHHPSETRKRIQGTISSISVRPVLENGVNRPGIAGGPKRFSASGHTLASPRLRKMSAPAYLLSSGSGAFTKSSPPSPPKKGNDRFDGFTKLQSPHLQWGLNVAYFSSSVLVAVILVADQPVDGAEREQRGGKADHHQGLNFREIEDDEFPHNG